MILQSEENCEEIDYNELAGIIQKMNEQSGAYGHRRK